jgi:hypothetical protein
MWPVSTPETVDFLVAIPSASRKFSAMQGRSRKVGDELCRRAAEAANRRFFGDRPEQSK